MNAYKELLLTLCEEMNGITAFFAFSENDLKSIMVQYGVFDSTDFNICKIGCRGGVCRLKDEPKVKEVYMRYEKKHHEAVDNDLTGEGYIFDMFRYELKRYGYRRTRELMNVFKALSLTYEDLENDVRLEHGFRIAIDYLDKPKSRKKANDGKKNNR